MPLSMYQASAPVLLHSFDAMCAIMDKAAENASARKIDPSVFIQARLAPDMFPFGRQIQVACDLAKGGVARLAGADIPKFDDTETTFDELKARVKKTQDFIASFRPDQIDGSEDKEIVLSFGPDNSMTFKGQPYLLHFVLPNVFFHLTTAYAILRSNGVDIGKRDFIGSF